MTNVHMSWKKVKHIGFVTAMVLAVSLAAGVGAAAAAAGDTRVVTDALGRQVTIPSVVRSVISTSPNATNLTYMLAPDKLLGWNSKPNPTNMPQKYQDLKVLGGWFGIWSGNYETMIEMHPDMIIYETLFDNPQAGDLNVLNERQKKFGSIPVVGVLGSGDLERLDDNIAFFGDILNAGDKAKALAETHRSFAETVSRRVASIPEKKRVRVYYAETPDGLSTDPEGSRHSALISLCGGINVAQIPVKEGMGQVKVSIEQVMQWNPQAAIVENPKFYQTIYKDPIWSKLDAVKNRRVYLAPRGPFNWFDRPPGANTILGYMWTGKKLYPDLFADIDLNGLAKTFYRDFFHMDMSDEQIGRMLDPLQASKHPAVPRVQPD